MAMAREGVNHPAGGAAETRGAQKCRSPLFLLAQGV